MEEQTIVTDIDENGETWVKPHRTQSCEVCESKQGCGVLSLSSLFGHHATPVKVLNTINAKVGDHVLITVPDQTVLRASVFAYLFPLFCLFFGASLAQLVFGLSDVAVIGVAFLSLLLGFVLIRQLTNSDSPDTHWRPVIRGVINQNKFKFNAAGNLNKF